MSEETKQEQPQQVDSELQNILEAAIFSADEPLSMRQLINLFPDEAQPSKETVQEALDSLQETYQTKGVELCKIGKGWRFQSREKYASWLRKLSKEKAPRFSRALLETLAIIAYRQPVTRGDIEEVRGVSVSSDTIRTLQEREWVKEVGHRDVPGRPTLFGTTQEFLEYFNLQSLRELPELMQQRDISEIASEMNVQLPVEPVEPEEQQSETDTVEEKSSADIIPLHPEQQQTEEPSAEEEPSAIEATDTDDEVESITEEEPDDGETT